MTEGRIAIRYAKALLELAVEQGVTDLVDADMRTLNKAIEDEKGLREMLGSPVIPDHRKKEVLEGLSLGTNQLTRDIIALLIDNKRIYLLQEVALKYRVLYRELKEEDVAHVTSAVPLTDDLREKVLNKVTEITGNQITIKNTVDDSIIGGFILRVGDIQYNASIANKLENIKREFIHSS